MKWTTLIFCLFHLSVCFGLSGDPYKTLGLSKRADQDEIKRAYKSLAKKWHPDRSKNHDAEAKFMAIASAYEVLSDPAKKENYDRYGNEDAPAHHGFHQQHDGGGGGGQYFYFRSSDGSRYAFRGDPFQHFQQHDPFARRRQNYDRTPLSQRIWAKLKTLPAAALASLGLDGSYSGAAIFLAVVTILGCGLVFRLLDVDKSKEASEAEARVQRPDSAATWLHEMNLQTYNGLLRLQRPGSRSIIVLVDTITQKALLTEFVRAVYPYRNHKTLTFGFLNLDTYLHWYVRLLRSSEACYGRPLNLELKNCLGTVLVLNNYKRCFSVFHAKTTPVKKKEGDDGFYGFSGSDESADEADVEAAVEKGKNRSRRRKEENAPVDLTTSQLRSDSASGDTAVLDGLSLWLERLFDGQVAKISVESWPNLKA